MSQMEFVMSQYSGNRLRMPFSRIIARDRGSLLMSAPIAPVSRAGPRLRSLYPELPGGGAERQAAFLTARALVMRGMRILGQPPVPVPPMRDGAAPWGGSISYTSDRVAVWLCRDPALNPGLNLMEPGDLPGSVDDEEAELLNRLPALARMTPDERIAAALSARRALFKALAPRIGPPPPGDCVKVVALAQSGLTLSLRRALGPGLPEGIRFRTEIRAFPGFVLTWVAAPLWVV